LKKELRYGYTTGACAAAAARGAALMLREQRIVEEAEILLPGGRPARFRLHGQALTDRHSSCFVVKDAGDDPDITNGAEIHAAIDVDYFVPHRIDIRGGTGVGRVTKPGLAVPVGEPAINPVPRKMIIENVKEVLAMRCIPAAFTVTISIPNGEELAKKTLNERLGILGGLSILGTTGIVKPISTRAWTDTIDCSIDVALASSAETVILSTGRTSELAAQKFLRERETLPEETFVMMGDHVGYSLCSCMARGAKRVVIAAQFAKLLKIACGHEQTHVSSSELDLQTLAKWCSLDPRTSYLEPVARQANTARQVLEDSGNDPELIRLVCGKAKESALGMAPGLLLKVMLVGYDSEVLYCGAAVSDLIPVP
jgi:cobalt-precorrin-5B (C1)-methyltransferase